MADRRRNLGIPSGVVFPFAGEAAPYGYLICDGRAVSRTDYPALFISLGSGALHGAGDGSTTFNLPDYRGKFMRGVDGTAGSDPDKATRTHPKTGAVAGNVVGSVQGHANESHTHIQNAHRHSVLGNTIASGGLTNLGPTGQANSGFAGTNGTAGLAYVDIAPNPGTNSYVLNSTPTNQDAGGNESRPKNVNVNYIVKV